jgi:hypothetical protein
MKSLTSKLTLIAVAIFSTSGVVSRADIVAEKIQRVGSDIQITARIDKDEAIVFYGSLKTQNTVTTTKNGAVAFSKKVADFGPIHVDCTATPFKNIFGGTEASSICYLTAIVSSSKDENNISEIEDVSNYEIPFINVRIYKKGDPSLYASYLQNLKLTKDDDEGYSTHYIGFDVLEDSFSKGAIKFNADKWFTTYTTTLSPLRGFCRSYGDQSETVCDSTISMRVEGQALVDLQDLGLKSH